MLRRSAQQVINSASRFARVSGRLALMMRQRAVRFYHGGHESKNFHDARLRLNSRSECASSTAAWRFSYA